MTTALPQYEATESLERFLGDPLEPKNGFSFQRAMELDEAEIFPEEFCQIVKAWGFHEYIVPESFGGKFRSFEETYALARVVNRRDQSIMAASYISFSWLATVFVAGNKTQQAEIAELVKAGKRLTFALSERGHGSDLLNCKFTAKKVEDGYLLNGEKWPIGMATLCDAWLIFAKTGTRGPTAFSVFLVRKDRIKADAITYSSKIKTLGMRGVDFSGFHLENCKVPQNAIIGRAGRGYELAIKAQQLVRMMSTAASLGCADTALRAVVDFAKDRVIEGRPVYQIPHARRMLVDIFADLLLCDTTGIAACRAAHAAPRQFSIWSAVVKYIIVTRTEHLIEDASILLGSRYFLREGHWFGMFQKALRDNAVVRVIDTNAIVNLNMIGSQLASLSKYAQNLDPQKEPEIMGRLEQVFRLNIPVPELNFRAMDIINFGIDDVMNGLAFASKRITLLEKSDTPHHSHILGQIEQLNGRREWLNHSVDRLKKDAGRNFNDSPTLVDLAQHYSEIHTAAVCVHFWLFNRTHGLGAFFDRGAWLICCLERVLCLFEPLREEIEPQILEEVLIEMDCQFNEDRLFSLVPIQLARRGSRQQRNGQE